MEQKPYANIARRRERFRRRIRHKLECHTGRIIRDTVEIRVRLEKLREAEEGEEGGVGAELDVEFWGWRGLRDGGVEGLEDLAGKSGAGDGADGGGGVVGEVEFVVVGEGLELEEGFGGEDGGGVEVGGVVDGGDLEQVPNWVEQSG